MGCAGNEQVITPCLDKMAKNGIMFTRAYCSYPVCSPSRASLLTGQYAHNQGHGVVCNNVQLSQDSLTIAELLKENNYKTGYIGKWQCDVFLTEKVRHDCKVA